MLEAIYKFLPEGVKRRTSIFYVVLAAFFIRAFFFTGGIRGSDAYAYAMYAFQIASGQYDINLVDNFYGFRFALLLPTALSYRLFGVGDYSSVLFPYLFSLLNILAVFFIAERIFDRKIAFIAAVLLAIYPLDITTANTLGPDSFIPCFSSLAMLCYVLADKKMAASENAIGYLLFTGLFIGLAYLSRITSIFILIALGFYHIVRRRKIRYLLWTIMGFSAPWLAEALYYKIYTGDPFFHYHRIAVHESLVKGPDPDAIVSLLFYPKVMFGFDLTGWALYGLTWWLVLVGLGLAFRQKDTRMLLPFFFLLIPFLGFEFGTQSLKEMIPIMKNYNYLSLITGPAVMIAAYAVKDITRTLFDESRKRLQAVTLVLLTFAVMNMYGVYRLAQNARDDAGPYEAVASVLAGKKHPVIYVHHERWPLFLKYFLRYDPAVEFRSLSGMSMKQIEDISGSYVVLHKRYLIADTAGRRFKQLPLYADYFDKPPKTWKRILMYSGEPDYNTVTIFYAGRKD